MGLGVFVRGFTPNAILFADVTPAFSEMFCAYGRTTANITTRAVSFAETASGVREDGEVTSAMAETNESTAD